MLGYHFLDLQLKFVETYFWLRIEVGKHHNWAHTKDMSLIHLRNTSLASKEDDMAKWNI